MQEKEATELLKRLDHILAATNQEGFTGEDLCKIYAEAKPIIDKLLPWIQAIPEWGATVALVIQTLEKLSDIACPVPKTA
jgi:hypothetical protein